MDVTDRCQMLNLDESEPNHSGQYDLVQARHGGCHSDSQPATVADTSPPASYVHSDGGYGWVIVIASFFVAFVIDGIGSSFGLLFPYILAKFGSSAFVASFAGSTFVAFMIMGSISVELVNKFGFRLVAVSGSILSCVAFVASVFSPNIYVFIITFGLLGGCSCGLVFIPSIIIVNEYFHQKRGIANGMISAGSGVGLLVLGPVINLLLDTYSLDGTILVLAGVLLNMCVCSSLFCCPDHRQQHTPSVGDDSQQLVGGQLALESLSSHLSTDNVDMFPPHNGQDMLKVVDHGTQGSTLPAFDAGQVVTKDCKDYFIKTAADPLSSDGHEDKANFYLEYVLHHLKPAVSAHLQQHRSAEDAGQQLRENRLHAGWNSEQRLDHTSTVGKLHHSYSLFDIPTWCQDKDRRQVQEYLLKRYKNFGDHQRVHRSHRSSHRHSQSLSVEQASNCYLAGSISTLLNLHNSFVHSLPESGLKPIHSLDNVSSKLPDITEHSGQAHVTCEKLLKQHSKDDMAGDMEQCLLLRVHEPGESDKPDPSVATDERDKPGPSVAAGGDHGEVSLEWGPDLPLGYTLAQLLCMPSFHFFCLGAALIQIGYPLAGTFLADYAYQFGLSTSHTAVLMSLLGGLNICGRLLAGCLVSLKLDPLLLNNLSLVLGGAACLLSPLYTQFWSLCMFAGMFGFFLGFFPPLQPLIIVKHFGLETLASAFGLLSTVKGVASILGAPLAGFIYDVTRQYSMSFIFGGTVFVLSSLVHCLMIVSEIYCRKRSQL